MKQTGNGITNTALMAVLSVLLLFGVVLFVSGNAAGEVTNDVCADCHDLVDAFANTPHGTYFADDSKLATAGCESCHGSAVEHIEDGDPAKIINPAKTDQFGGDVLCLNCHRGHEFDDWSFSAHNNADVGCASCHTIHTTGTMHGSLKKEPPELCYDCHSDVKAASHMPSHHPIAEGKMQCQDCHAIHGGQTAFTDGYSSKELCLSCHADKEGPFVYEHAPVTEDCMICHTPHGSVADKMLVQNEPTLCLNCHAMHFHATVQGTEQEFFPPADSTRITESHRDSWKKGFLTKCTQCHTQVHGSDLPSQTISTGGNALTR